LKDVKRVVEHLCSACRRPCCVFCFEDVPIIFNHLVDVRHGFINPAVANMDLVGRRVEKGCGGINLMILVGDAVILL